MGGPSYRKDRVVLPARTKTGQATSALPFTCPRTLGSGAAPVGMAETAFCKRRPLGDTDRKCTPSPPRAAGPASCVTFVQPLGKHASDGFAPLWPLTVEPDQSFAEIRAHTSRKQRQPEVHRLVGGAVDDMGAPVSDPDGSERRSKVGIGVGIRDPPPHRHACERGGLGRQGRPKLTQKSP